MTEERVHYRCTKCEYGISGAENSALFRMIDRHWEETGHVMYDERERG